MRKRLLTQFGFTFLEMLIVLGLIAVVSGTMILNFRVTATNATARRQTVQIIISDIRRAQAMAIAGSAFNGADVCGYGISYKSPASYVLYVKLPSGPLSCRSDLARSRNYVPGMDFLIGTPVFANTNMQFSASFNDIYFELPEPLTYLNNNSSPITAIPVSIKIKSPGVVGETTITVYQSGKVDTIEQ